MRKRISGRNSKSDLGSALIVKYINTKALHDQEFDKRDEINIT